MPHQCTKCGKVYPDAAEELLKGCTCNARFFYYIRQEKFDKLQSEVQEVIKELEKADKDQIEKDIRELTGLTDKPDEPVILDLESVRVIKPGKFEIDLVNLFSKNRPLIYKLEEGKYIIDLASSLAIKDTEKTKDKIKPSTVLDDIEEEEEEEEEDDEAEEEKEKSEKGEKPKESKENKEDTNTKIKELE